MNSLGFKTILFFLILSILILPFTSCAQANRTKQKVIEEMVVSFGSYTEEALEIVNNDLIELKKIDKSEGAKWNQIMDLWQRLNQGITINDSILPDGLPDTDELCIVALGFQLNDDGTMKDELIDRLQVVKRSAEKYPNAYIVVTGGGTAVNDSTATEADRMAEWLLSEGILSDRIIIENHSLTTAQNAMYTYTILKENYPMVRSLAIISSHYHITTGYLFFEAECILREPQDEQIITVISNASCYRPTGSLSTMFQAGGLIELSGDEKTAYEIYYDTYDIHSLPFITTKEKS